MPNRPISATGPARPTTARAVPVVRVAPTGRASRASRAARTVLAWLAIAAAAPSPAATVEVRFEGLSSDRGRALFALFDHAEGFPDRADVASARLGGTVAGGRASVVFEGVAPGDYALSALHDENGSGGIDMNLFGLPKEKFGVSNVAKGRPTWSDARFNVAADGDVVVIEVRPLRFF